MNVLWKGQFFLAWKRSYLKSQHSFLTPPTRLKDKMADDSTWFQSSLPRPNLNRSRINVRDQLVRDNISPEVWENGGGRAVGMNHYCWSGNMKPNFHAWVLYRLYHSLDTFITPVTVCLWWACWVRSGGGSGGGRGSDCSLISTNGMLKSSQLKYEVVLLTFVLHVPSVSKAMAELLHQ